MESSQVTKIITITTDWKAPIELPRGEFVCVARI